MMPLEKLLTRFRDQQAHLAVVVDEFGVNVGIVTLQRVIAEVIGQLSDELGLGRWEFGGSPPTSSWWTAHGRLRDA
jgi:CBS domain containing-hemolysin-like protein